MNIELFKNLNIFKNIFSEDENNRILNVYKMCNLHLTGYSLYYPNVLLKNNNKLILPVLEKTMSLNCGSIYEEENMKYNYTSNKILYTNTSPLFFFIYNTDNYFHFLYDTLPYLISYIELKTNIKDLKLLMQYPNSEKMIFYPFVIELLELRPSMGLECSYLVAHATINCSHCLIIFLPSHPILKQPPQMGV